MRFPSLFFCALCTRCHAAALYAPPPSFIVATGPIERGVLAAVRDSLRGVPVDVPKLTQYCHRANPKWAASWAASGAAGAGAGAGAAATAVLSSALPAVIPCSVLHPQNRLCTVQVCACGVWLPSRCCRCRWFCC
jgi:hypothetical protein